MASTQFRCPNCRTLLTKSAADQVFSAVLADGGRGAMVGGPQYYPCPGCGYEIERMKVVRGEYDEKPASGGVGGVIVIIIVVVGIILWALSP